MSEAQLVKLATSSTALYRSLLEQANTLNKLALQSVDEVLKRKESEAKTSGDFPKSKKWNVLRGDIRILSGAFPNEGALTLLSKLNAGEFDTPKFRAGNWSLRMFLSKEDRSSLGLGELEFLVKKDEVQTNQALAQTTAEAEKLAMMQGLVENDQVFEKKTGLTRSNP